jgi:hypothetical protein
VVGDADDAIVPGEMIEERLDACRSLEIRSVVRRLIARRPSPVIAIGGMDVECDRNKESAPCQLVFEEAVYTSFAPASTRPSGERA